MTPPGKTRSDVGPATIITAGGLGGMAYWTGESLTLTQFEHFRHF
jgi:hypothetical protein